MLSGPSKSRPYRPGVRGLGDKRHAVYVWTCRLDDHLQAHLVSLLAHTLHRREETQMIHMYYLRQRMTINEGPDDLALEDAPKLFPRSD